MIAAPQAVAEERWEVIPGAETMESLRDARARGGRRRGGGRRHGRHGGRGPCAAASSARPAVRGPAAARSRSCTPTDGSGSRRLVVCSTAGAGCCAPSTTRRGWMGCAASARLRTTPPSPASPTSSSASAPTSSPGQIVAIGCRSRARSGRGPRVRRQRLPARRQVRRRLLLRPARQARADRVRRRGHARLRARPGTASGSSRSASSAPRAIGAHRARSPRACSTTSTPRASAATSCPSLRETGKVVNDRTTNWTSAPVPDAAPGRSSSTPTSTRRALATLVGAARARLPARRGRPRRGLARARRHARRRRRAADRAPLRRAALRGPGHRPDGRPAAELALAWRRASRPSTGSRTCPTSRRRRSSPRPTRRAPTASCASTKPLVLRRHDRPRAEVELRGRPRRRDRRRGGRRGAARLRARATRAPRGWARSRSSTARAASARSTPSSSTRCSTRTPPATSRSAAPTSSCVDDEPTPSASTESTIHVDFMIGSPEVRRHRRRPPTASAMPVLATAPGRSEPRTLRAAPGEVPERLNGHDWKSCVGFTVHRGFESLPLR